MEERFFVPIMDFDPSWMMKGYESSLYALEYCEYSLKIPAEHILEAFLRSNGLEVTIRKDKIVTHEEWYLNLKYLSSTRKAS
jgi:hypothetical protein